MLKMFFEKHFTMKQAEMKMEGNDKTSYKLTLIPLFFVQFNEIDINGQLKKFNTSGTPPLPNSLNLGELKMSGLEG